MTSREQRHTAILEAAFRVFSQSGYHQAKIEDIARETGIGKGTVYEYFESKSQLFHEMVRHIISEYNSGLAESLSRRDCIRDRLVDFAQYHAQVLSQNMNMAQAVSADINAMTLELRDMLIKQKAESTHMLAQVVAGAISKRELRADLDAEIATMVVFGTVNQYFAKKICVERKEVVPEDAERVIDTLLKGMTE